jgi:nitrogen fixation-related uncharacterized protein
MLPLAGLVAAAVGVILAVAYWSLRSGGFHDHDDYDETGIVREHDQRPERDGRTRPANARPPAAPNGITRPAVSGRDGHGNGVRTDNANRKNGQRGGASPRTRAGHPAAEGGWTGHGTGTAGHGRSGERRLAHPRRRHGRAEHAHGAGDIAGRR